MNQEPVAQLCGVSRVQVSRWEHGLDLPSAQALLKLSELASAEDRQWWRDQAATQAGFGEDDKSTLETFVNRGAYRTIPLIKSSKKVGELGSLNAAAIEQNLLFPANWFPEGGTIRAVRINELSISPVVVASYIALIDISYRDPDRLVGCIVAMQTPEGIEVRGLRKDGATYLLVPLRDDPDHPIRVLRHHGENSIIGKVVRWIGEPAPVKGRG